MLIILSIVTLKIIQIIDIIQQKRVKITLSTRWGRIMPKTLPTKVQIRLKSTTIEYSIQENLVLIANM